jgi:hypothetical protein
MNEFDEGTFDFIPCVRDPVVNSDEVSPYLEDLFQWGW